MTLFWRRHYQDDPLDAGKKEIGVKLVSRMFLFLWNVEVLCGLDECIQQAEVRGLWNSSQPLNIEWDNNRTR
jgi:hypothetical protein